MNDNESGNTGRLEARARLINDQMSISFHTKAMTRLVDVSIRLVAGLIVLLLAANWIGWLDFVGEVSNAPIHPLERHGYQAELGRKDIARWFYSIGDTVESPRASRLRLFEDGQPLGEAHADHQELDRRGGGLFSHWGGWLRFSAGDNSDPRSNGRRYTFALPPIVWRVLLLPGLLLLVLVGWRQAHGLAGGVPEFRLAAVGLARVRKRVNDSRVVKLNFIRSCVFGYAVSFRTKAMAWLIDVGVRLVAGLIVLLLAANWIGGLDFVGEISDASIRPLERHGYQAELIRKDKARWFYSIGDTVESPRASRLRLFEDGQPLGESHADHQELDRRGGGLFSHWGGWLNFSTSDNSDPRSNGRRYTFALPPIVWRVLLLPGLLLLVLVGWRQAYGLAGGMPEFRLVAEGVARVWKRVNDSRVVQFRFIRYCVFGYAVSFRTKAMAWLIDVGIRLVAGLIVLLLAANWIGTLDFVGEISNASVRPLELHGYQAELSRKDAARWFYSIGDTAESPRASRLRLFEDGQQLGESHADHQELDRRGGGLFSHWAGWLNFSTSDNSDPRSNGRRYTFALPPIVWRVLLPPGLLLLGLVGWRQAHGLAGGMPEFRFAAAGLARVRKKANDSRVIQFALRRSWFFGYAASLAVAAYFVGCYVFGAPPVPVIMFDSQTYWVGARTVPIGYPAFLRTIYGVFESLRAITIVQATLFAAAVISVQTGIARFTGSNFIASVIAIALIALGAAPSTAIWLMSESVFTSILLFHVAAASWALALATRKNLVALASTAILAVIVRPAGYFLVGGILFLLLFWAGQRRMVLYWALGPLAALLLVMYGIDLKVNGLNSGNAGVSLFPHVAHLYDRPPPDLPPEITADIEGPLLKLYRLELQKARGWEARQALEQIKFNDIAIELMTRAPKDRDTQKVFLSLALYTIKQHPLGYLQTVADNLAVWYVRGIFALAPHTGDVLGNAYQWGWLFSQQFIAKQDIHQIDVTLDNVKSDYLLTRPGALVLPFDMPMPLKIWIRGLYLAFGVLGTVAFTRGYGGRKAGVLSYVAVLAFGGALLVSISTVFIPRYATPLDPLVLIVVLLGVWHIIATSGLAIGWINKRIRLVANVRESSLLESRSP